LVDHSARDLSKPLVTRRLAISDAAALADLFESIDATYFSPHPFTVEAARSIAGDTGPNIYLATFVGSQAVAYGLLRGWDEGFEVPSLGLAVRSAAAGRGYGRRMMAALHAAARNRGARAVRLRVHPENKRARHLYESAGYRVIGNERGEDLMLIDLA
jgi:ribosomal-protein-alanine N-acetyltransferase